MADDLKTIVQRMIDAGESEDNIRTVIQHFQAQTTPGLKVVGRVQSDDSREQIHEPTTWWGGFSKSLLDQTGVGDPDSPLSHAARPQTGGDIAGLLLPNAAVAGAQAVDRAIPNTTRAAANFRRVEDAARNVPVNLSAPGDVALRIQELGDTGARVPRVVGRLVARATDPAKGPVNYPEGRKFASNIGRLSTNEFNSINPAVQREMNNLRVAMNDAMGGAAEQVGMREPYESAMSEYARAAKLRGVGNDIAAGAKKALPVAIGTGVTGAGYYAAKKLLELLSGDK